MGLIVSTDERGIKVWRDDKGQYPRYSVSVSKKNDQGGYDNCYLPVRFKNGVDVPNGTEILIKNAFPSFNIGQDGKKYPYYMITEFENMNSVGGFENIPDGVEEELPFN